MWTPKTKLGQDVLANKYQNLTEVVKAGYRIKEPQIVDHFNENFQTHIFSTRRVNKTISSGKFTRYSIHLLLGNGSYLLGLGTGKSKDRLTAVKKAVTSAKKNLIHVKVGHRLNPETILQRKLCRVGSSTVQISPVSVKTGLVGGKFVKILCTLAGVKDLRVKLKGSKNRLNYIQALFKSLK